MAYERKRAEIFISQEGKEKGYDCQVCKNRGWFMVVQDDGSHFMRRCHCMTVRDSLAAMRRSGLPEEAIHGLSFDSWETPHKWQEDALNMAKRYSEASKTKGFSDWFIMSGRPGCGKTKLCSTVFLEVVKGGMEGRYLSWRDFARNAKSVANDREKFQEIVGEAKKTPILYLDDFWKGQITPAEVNLAFELLNDRYQRTCLTILSSEHTIDAIIRGDEAIGSRMREKSANFYMDLSRAENWRLR